MPGDYVQNSTAGSARLSAAAKEQMIHSYGLDSSVAEGYIHWISNGIRGDLGTSFLYKKPVVQVICEDSHDPAHLSSSLVHSVDTGSLMGISSPSGTALSGDCFSVHSPC